MIQPYFVVQRTPREWDIESWERDEDQPRDTMTSPEKALKWLLHELGQYLEYGKKHKFRIVARNEKVHYDSDEIERRLK